MKNDTATIILNGSKEAIEAINSKIKEQKGSQSQVTSRRNLDGDTATWMVIATLTSQALPHILSFIKENISSKKVTKLIIDDLQVENPTAEMIESFRKILQDRANKSAPNE